MNTKPDPSLFWDTVAQLGGTIYWSLFLSVLFIWSITGTCIV